MRILTAILIAAVLVIAPCESSFAWFLDFEEGRGMDQRPILKSVPGLQFTATGGYDWVYGDATSGNWNVCNELRESWGSGEYNMEGYVFAFLGQGQTSGRIDFLNQNGSYFTTGYSTSSNFYLEAYDGSDNLIDAAWGSANTQNQETYRLEYLTVSSASNNIAYIMINDTSNFWLVDNMSGDASGIPEDPIPEPSTMLLLGFGLLGGSLLRRRLK